MYKYKKPKCCDVQNIMNSMRINKNLISTIFSNFRSKKIIYNPKERELDVPSLTVGDSLLLHEAYQYLVKRYITDRKNRDQLPQSKSIKKIKQEEISIKENEDLPKNIQKSRKNSKQVADTSDDNDNENNESEEDESGEPQEDPDSS